MDDDRRPDLRVPSEHDRSGITRGRPLTFTFDDVTIAAFEGETIGAALLVSGQRELRRTRGNDRPRGLYCGTGACFDCLVSVDGGSPTRACLTPARADAEVTSGR